MTPDAAELQRRARRLLPPSVYDYYAGGPGRERTLRDRHLTAGLARRDRADRRRRMAAALIRAG